MHGEVLSPNTTTPCSCRASANGGVSDKQQIEPFIFLLRPVIDLAPIDSVLGGDSAYFFIHRGMALLNALRISSFRQSKIQFISMTRIPWSRHVPHRISRLYLKQHQRKLRRLVSTGCTEVTWVVFDIGREILKAMRWTICIRKEIFIDIPTEDGLEVNV